MTQMLNTIGLAVAWGNEPDPEDPTVDVPDELVAAVDNNPPSEVLAEDEQARDRVAAAGFVSSVVNWSIVILCGAEALIGPEPEFPALVLPAAA